MKYLGLMDRTIFIFTVAEIGGYLGMLVGVSLMDLKGFVLKIQSTIYK